MISQDLMQMLRCPLDPRKTQLDEAPDALVCRRCRVRFPIKEGIPCMLIEEAELPPNCNAVRQLPCQQPEANG